MRKLFATILAIVGGIALLYSGYCYFVAGTTVFGVHALYPGLGSIAVLTGGLIMRAE